MSFVMVWFILTTPANGVIAPGYIKPQDVYLTDMQCGLSGAVVGVHVDRIVNPQFVTWPDPFFEGVHCSADISARVAALPLGEYHIATTIVGADLPFGTPVPHVNGHDPHTTTSWLRAAASTSIGRIRITPPQ